MNKYLILILLISLSGLFGCKKDELIGDQTLDVIEAGVTAFSEVADDVENESLARHYNNRQKSPLELFLNSMNILKAHAADCTGRPGSLTCSAGDKNLIYDQCTIPGTDQVVNGFVNLDFNDETNCLLDSTGDSVTRTFEFTRTTPWGAVITSTSDLRTDYNNITYGGGGTLTRLSNNSFEMEVLGKHRTRTTVGGRSAYDISIRTITPVGISAIARASRQISGGRLEVAHNIRNFTVALEPNSLTFEDTCCYPVSGSINIEIFGSINTTGQITFNGCENATVTKNGVTSNIGLYSCE